MKPLISIVLVAAFGFAGCSDAAVPNAPVVPVAPSQTQAIADPATAPSSPTPPSRPVLTSRSAVDMANFSAALAGEFGLVKGQSIDVAKLAIQAYLDSLTSQEGDVSVSQKTTYLSNGITQITATITGMPDDSVADMQLAAHFVPVTPARADLSQYGVRIKCARGENTQDWQTTLCP